MSYRWMTGSLMVVALLASPCAQAQAKAALLGSKPPEADFARLFGPDMRVRFEQTDAFPHSSTGKFRWIICQLDEVAQLRAGHSVRLADEG